ncbi:ABC transporter [Wenjunlia vitaminophila]|uniref:ABC transporter n=1 Tax=Wenjunlia vitaminophila TaxID=76728 RepID=A0A0T6LTW1_WENVI|nr:ABC transporter permease [Wenjunlia vitaminophila]KRV49444.1 ABC transporter [Wenjunlia vitaminophila]
MTVTTAVLKSEWTKVRSVRSTVWTLASAFAVTVGLSAALCAVMNANFDQLSSRDQATFDATSISFAGMFLGQLAIIVFGVLVVGSEYSTGMIRTSLAAVPQRGTFLFCKMGVATVLALVTAMATSFSSFFCGQALLGSHRTTIGAPEVLRAVFGAGLYMTMLAIFAMGVAAMLRSPILALGVLMPFFFLVSTILANVPGAKEVARYFPDQAGSRVTRVVPSTAPYGPWEGFGIMGLWVVAALVGGYLVIRNRDA